MWSQASETFIDLGDYSEYNVRFGYSWSEDGQTLYVPDEEGIAALDINTLERHHWLSLPIKYLRDPPVPSSLAIRCQKSFEVSGDGTIVVYCSGNKLILTELGPRQEVLRETVLGEFESGCCFTLSPDGRSVAFVFQQQGNFLFTHGEREVWFYHNGRTKRLFFQDGERINDMTDVFW